jgi:hypothetical protein
LRGNLGQAVQQLKRESGKGLFVGGVKLPLALTELGLIDEYEFVVHPRLAGHGPTLFAGLSKHVDLKLVSRLSSARVQWRCGTSREGSHRACRPEPAASSSPGSRLSFGRSVQICHLDAKAARRCGTEARCARHQSARPGGRRTPSSG